MRTCKRCTILYAPERSTSGLRLTYCSLLCERADLGFTIEGFLRMEPALPLRPKRTHPWDEPIVPPDRVPAWSAW